MFKNLNPAALGVFAHQSEIIELALTYGFKGMDLDIREFAARTKANGLPYARRLIDSARIRVGSFQLPVDLEADEEQYQEQVRQLPDLAKLAAEMGCTRCLWTVSPAGDHRPYHENFECHRRRIVEIAQVLDPMNIRLGVGFRGSESLRKGRAFQFIHEYDALSLLLSMVGAPNVGLLVDVWEMYLCGSLEALRTLKAPQVVAVQLADAPADVARTDLTEEHRLLPGNGHLNPTEMLAGLADLGYDGPVWIKADRKAFEGTRREDVVKQAGEAIDTLLKAVGFSADGKRIGAPRSAPASAPTPAR
jgi:sugar phosphate isomerase/epimerase